MKEHFDNLNSYSTFGGRLDVAVPTFVSHYMTFL